MQKYSNFAIVVSFFCLWIDSIFSEKYQVILGFLLIFSFGILHGANDIVLLKRLNNSQKSISFFKIFTYYVAIVLLGIVAFYVFPLIALILFIIVSAFHFGEQQWQKFAEIINYKFKTIFMLIYGLFILLLLFNFHQTEVQNIVLEITQTLIPVHYNTIALEIVSIILFVFFLYLYIYEPNFRQQLILEMFYLLVFAVIFISSSLIWGFAIFFIIWHSIPSMIDQIGFLYEDVNSKNLKLYIKSAFIYWIISLSGIALLYFIFRDQKLFVAIFFSFLAAITFPHAIVIIKMFNKK